MRRALLAVVLVVALLLGTAGAVGAAGVQDQGSGDRSVDGSRNPTDEPLPAVEENPVRVCMQQTGQTRFECRRDIRRSNGLPVLP